MGQKKGFIWAGVIIIIIAVILVFAWQPNQSSAPATEPGGSGTNNTPSGPQPVYAPPGQVVAQFPKELIVDSAAQVSQSYSIGYSTTTNQYTAQYNSSSSLDTLVAKYKAYFAAKGWKVTMNPVTSASIRGISASDGKSYAGVNLVVQGKNIQVTVTYVPQ